MKTLSFNSLEIIISRQRTLATSALLALFLLASLGLHSQGLLEQDFSNSPIVPINMYQEQLPSLDQATSALNSSNQEEKFRAALTYFFHARDLDGQGAKADEVFKYASAAANAINDIFRRNRNNSLVGLYSGLVTMYAGGESPKLKDKISLTNRGLASFDALLGTLPNMLEGKQMYLRSAVHVPTFFKDLREQLLNVSKDFLDKYDSAYASLTSPGAKERLANLKTQVLIVRAEALYRKSRDRGEAAQVLAQVDTSQFPTLQKESGQDLIDIYNELKKKMA